MINLGDIAVGKIVNRVFTTNNPVGVPVSMAGSPAFAVYKNNTTSSSTSGLTFTADLDARVGMNVVKIDTSADGTFYSSGADFALVITAGTISGQNVTGTIIASFSIENRSALRPTVAGRTLAIAAAGQAGIDWANIGSPTATQGLSGTTILDATNVETKLGTPAGASVSADIASVKSDTTTIKTQTTAASIAAAVWNALAASYTIVGSFGAQLQAAVPSVSSVAAAVWNSVRSSFTTTGSFGQSLQALVDVNTSTLQPTSTALTQYNALQAVLATLQTAATAFTQYSTTLSALGTLQQASTALSQFNSIISAVGTPQQTSVALTQYNNLQTALSAVQQASTAATQYTAIQNAIAAVQQASTALSQFNTLVSDIGAISSITPTQVAQAVWNAQTSDYDEDGSFGDTVQSGGIDPTEVAQAVWNALLADYDIVGTFGANAQNPPLDPSQIASAVWDALVADYDTAGTFGANAQTSQLTPQQVAQAVWNAVIANYQEVGSTGEALFMAGQEGDNIEKILALMYQVIINLPVRVSIGDNNVMVDVGDPADITVKVD